MDDKKQIFILEWDFHVYTVQFEEKRVEKKSETFSKVEDLLKAYRQKKDALFAGCINYNDNFKIYQGICTEVDINGINVLM